MAWRGVRRALVSLMSSTASAPANSGCGGSSCRVRPRSVLWQITMLAAALPASRKVSR